MVGIIICLRFRLVFVRVRRIRRRGLVWGFVLSLVVRMEEEEGARMGGWEDGDVLGYVDGVGGMC